MLLLVGIAGAFVGLNLVILWTLLYQLMRQHGRLLMMQHALQLELRRTCGLPDTEPDTPNTLPVGSLVPALDAVDLNGSAVGSSTLRGRRTMAIYIDPRCQFCELLALKLAESMPALLRVGIGVLLLSRGSRTDTEAFAGRHRLADHITLIDAREPWLFEGVGTPASYLIDVDGRIGSQLQIGSSAVIDMIAGLTSGYRSLRLRPITHSRIERNGLPPGSKAPAFSLPDAQGGVLASDAYLGQRFVLLLTDPECAPCRSVMQALVKWRTAADSPINLVSVVRGDIEANRAVVRDLGVDWPVAVQPGWSVSRLYGIFTVPVAYLVDAKGTIAANVAIGPEAIMRLVMTAGKRPVSV